MKPRWEDLAEAWQDVYKPQQIAEGDPSARWRNAGLRDDASFRNMQTKKRGSR